MTSRRLADTPLPLDSWTRDISQNGKKSVSFNELMRMRKTNIPKKTKKRKTPAEIDREGKKRRIFVQEHHPSNHISQMLIIEGASDKQWPLETKCLCHWECHGFTTEPIPLPTRKSKGKYIVRSNIVFCSINCGRAYCREHGLNDLLLIQMANDVYGFKYSTIVDGKRVINKEIFAHAPPRECLVAFCGPSGITIEEFRASFSVPRRLIYPPFCLETARIVTRRIDIEKGNMTSKIVREETGTIFQEPNDEEEEEEVEEEQDSHPFPDVAQLSSGQNKKVVYPPPGSVSPRYFSREQSSWDKRAHSKGLGKIFPLVASPRFP